MRAGSPAPSGADIAAWAETILDFADGRLTIDLREPVPASAKRGLATLGLDQPFAVITPCNPRGRVLPASANAERLAAAAQVVAGRTPPAVAAEGRSPDGLHREPGWAIVMPEARAVELARAWKQLGFYWWDGRQFRIVQVKPDQPPEVAGPS